MKIKIKRIYNCIETEVNITCCKIPDEETTLLLSHLRLFSHTAIGLKNSETHKIPINRIFYFECVDEKIFFYTATEVFESPKKLYEWESELKNTPFVRISKSTILNTEKLKSVHPFLNGKLEATLINDEKQIINRHYVLLFREKFGL